MTLTFTLTDTEYLAVMDSLHEAVVTFGGYRTRSKTLRERSVHALELEHLCTLLAEAAVGWECCPRCNLPTAVCDETNRIVDEAAAPTKEGSA